MDTDCCPATHFHSLVFWRWSLGILLRTRTCTMQWSSRMSCCRARGERFCDSNSRCCPSASLESFIGWKSRQRLAVYSFTSHVYPLRFNVPHKEARGKRESRCNDADDTKPRAVASGARSTTAVEAAGCSFSVSFSFIPLLSAVHAALEHGSGL